MSKMGTAKDIPTTLGCLSEDAVISGEYAPLDSHRLASLNDDKRMKNKIEIKYIADETRVYKVRKVAGRLMLNKGIQTFVDESVKSVEDSVFGLNVLSDESLINQSGISFGALKYLEFCEDTAKRICEEGKSRRSTFPTQQEIDNYLDRTNESSRENGGRN